MWMRGYNNNLTSSSGSSPVNNGSGGGATDHGQFGNTISPADSFNGRRLRPLIPKPSSIPIPPTCFNHGNCDTNNFFPLNHPMVAATSHHHYMGVGEQCRRDQVNGHQAVVVSSRWNPTPDQLRALEELYRRGTRTPSADQIQHITAQLRRHGKIEGKNVFYWFQNHKARERQKRRRQQLDNSASSSSPNDHQQSQDHQDQQQKKDPEGDESNHDGNKGSTTGFEIEQTKLWTAPTNCSTLADQVSEHNKQEKAAVECVADDEWVQFQDQHNYSSSATILRDTAEEHRRRRTSLNLITKKNNANWNNIHLSLPTDPSSISFTKSNVMNETSMVNEGDADQCDNNERALTLELFPLRSNVTMDLMKDDDGDDDGDEKGTHLTSYQFFEFLPLKNSTAY
ncbi:hypothetical protein QQ045_023328 [Rhodiola kirilowii]